MYNSVINTRTVVHAKIDFCPQAIYRELIIGILGSFAIEREGAI